MPGRTKYPGGFARLRRLRPAPTLGRAQIARSAERGDRSGAGVSRASDRHLPRHRARPGSPLCASRPLPRTRRRRALVRCPRGRRLGARRRARLADRSRAPGRADLRRRLRERRPECRTVLASHGLTATVFCVAGHLGGRNDWESERAGGYDSSLVTADELQALAAAGIEIGSHGFGHLPASEPRGAALEREIEGSQEMLERLTGTSAFVCLSVRCASTPEGAEPRRANVRCRLHDAGRIRRSATGRVRASSRRRALPAPPRAPAASRGRVARLRTSSPGGSARARGGRSARTT